MPSTDIVILADVSTQGRSPQQVEAQLRQKIHGFCAQVAARFGERGLRVKKATIFTADPGKCAITVQLADAAWALAVQGLLAELWNQIAWVDASDDSDAARFERLVEELVDLGCSTHRSECGFSYYWLSGDATTKHPRVCEIGRELYQLGGRRLGKMQEAAERVSAAIGAGALGDLSWHWHETGLEEWRQQRGECWLA